MLPMQSKRDHGKSSSCSEVGMGDMTETTPRVNNNIVVGCCRAETQTRPLSARARSACLWRGAKGTLQEASRSLGATWPAPHNPAPQSTVTPAACPPRLPFVLR